MPAKTPRTPPSRARKSAPSGSPARPAPPARPTTRAPRASRLPPDLPRGGWRAEREWDLLVVGGGVHGAAITRDAAARGLSVLLVEKNDFASGTSSRSSKLAHGGLRYLEHFEMGLVRESLHERDALLRVAPHLSWPLPFLIPLTGPKPRAGWMVRIGLSLYDMLAGRSSLGRHSVISARDANVMAPALDGCGMDRAAQYFDAGMDDERIVIELVLDAARLGATCANHVRATRLLRRGGRVVGATLAGEGGATHEARAKAVVLSSGPWLDALAPRRSDGSKRLQLTKGVHVFVRRQLVRDAALMLAAPQDGRIFFVIPWKGGSLIGTTDTAFADPADRVRPLPDDVRYLLAAVNRTLPSAKVKPGEVIAAQAGLRPLIANDRPGKPSSISRDWRLDDATPGLFVVEGGKYTIFRKLAERVVDSITETLESEDPSRSFGPCVTDRRLLPGAAPDWEEARATLVTRLSKTLPAASAEHLVRRYGVRAKDVAAMAARSKTLLRPPCDDHPHVPAEAVNAVRHEFAKTPADALLRRLDLPWWECGGLRCRDAWAAALREGGLDEDTVASGLRGWQRELARDWRV